MNVYYWRVWCTTDEEFKYVWDETKPSLCPYHHDSNITDSETTIVKGLYQEEPVSSDGRKYSNTPWFPTQL